MKRRQSLPKLLFLCCFLALAGNLYSQSISKGDLRGKVVASDTKGGLPGATVIVVGSNLGTATDINGNFLIRGVDAGKQSVSISYVGCQSKIIQVMIRADKITDLHDVLLNVSAIKDHGVVVTAQRAGQQSAINQQLSSNSIVNVVAADRLQENPDANAAEAIGRLPGISLIRSGGEGTGVVIRGLPPQYSQILLDGIPLPTTNISGISEYVLQGVEVFKTITPDMEGDAVAGAINLKLSEAPRGFKYNLMAQGGYNHLNNYWKNYKLVGDISDRFIDDKLGVMAGVDVESVNRSDETLSAGYETKTIPPPGQLAPLYVSGINLNDEGRINGKAALTLMLDYKLSSLTKIISSNFYSHTGQNYTDVTKSYDINGGGVSYQINDVPNNNSELYLSSIKVVHQFKYFELDEGVAFSQSHIYTPSSRDWTFSYMGAGLRQYGNTETQSLPLNQILAGAIDTSSAANLSNFELDNMSYVQSDLMRKNFDAHVDAKIPFDLGNSVAGYFKLGGEYRENLTESKYNSAGQVIYNVYNIANFAQDSLPWVGKTLANNISMLNLNGPIVNNFLKSGYYFGWYPDIGRLNQIFDWWNNLSNYYLYTDPQDMPPAFSNGHIGFLPNWNAIKTNTYSVNEFYYAGYLMGEFDFGNLISLIPGVRYEKVKDKLGGWWLENITVTNPYTTPGYSTDSTHNDSYWLPRINLKIKPTDWLQALLSYTEALGRPSYSLLVPNILLNRSTGAQSYTSGNPDLKPEIWKSYDAQLAVFGSEVGLVSLDAFYKTVTNKIWTPSIYRTSGEPWPFGIGQYFSNNATVLITVPQNHNFPVYLHGVEFEAQTNLWYLPRPFSYISLDVNFTLVASQTKYEYSKTQEEMVGTDNRGRPIYQLVTADSIYSGPMLNQPKSIVNLSFGYNYKGFNMWLSYQYTGGMVTSFPNLTEFENLVSPYRLMDLQIAQKLPLNGLEVLFDVANINDAVGYQNYLADPRATYMESYGWTSDFGIRYTF